jgi:hypothetical protein
MSSKGEESSDSGTDSDERSGSGDDSDDSPSGDDETEKTRPDDDSDSSSSSGDDSDSDSGDEDDSDDKTEKPPPVNKEISKGVFAAIGYTVKLQHGSRPPLEHVYAVLGVRYTGTAAKMGGQSWARYVKGGEYCQVKFAGGGGEFAVARVLHHLHVAMQPDEEGMAYVRPTSQSYFHTIVEFEQDFRVVPTTTTSPAENQAEAAAEYRENHGELLQVDARHTPCTLHDFLETNTN